MATTTLADALDLVGVDSGNVKDRLVGIREKGQKWVESSPAPEKLKEYMTHFLRATTDVDIPLKDLAILVGAAAYVIMPFDFIPDLIPMLGWGDDIAIVGLAMDTLRKHWDRTGQLSAMRGGSSSGEADVVRLSDASKREPNPT